MSLERGEALCAEKVKKICGKNVEGVAHAKKQCCGIA